MKAIFKITNWTVLLAQGIICLLGTFYKHIAFGWGLGDILWYVFMYGLFIAHLILTIKSIKKGISRHAILTLVFLISTIFICLQATIWRDNEYPWNGEIFYNYNSTSRPLDMID